VKSLKTDSAKLEISVYLILIVTFLGCSNNNMEETGISNRQTIIVNIANDSCDEYIGRGLEYHTHMLAKGIKNGEKGWLGNPHPIGWCDICSEYHTRDECIEEFKKDFYKKIKDDPGFREAVYLLKGKKLGCYCKPKKCHGDVIKDWIKAQ